MKILLLVALLTAGATTSRVTPQAGRRFGTLFQCTVPLIFEFTGYNHYGCYCNFIIRNNRMEDLDKCCQTRDNCRAQIKKLENCTFLIENPRRSFYTYLCSGNGVTCSEENDTCEDLICKCDLEAANCFYKQKKGIHC